MLSLAELSFVHLIALGWIFLMILGVYAVVAYFIFRAQKSLPKEHQKIAPGLAFLLLIPVAGLAMIFVLVFLVPDSFRSFFRSKGVDRGDCGKTLGLVWAGCAVATVIPLVACLTCIPALVFMILFLVKINTLAQEAVALANEAPRNPAQPPPLPTAGCDHP
jgi:hypothetical protein